tara:strand:- start:395 stop:1777 length:1383 start_codon:yes stop_codon:yes gene_type:complete
MAYIGQGIKGGTFSVLDTSGNTYNGSNVTFDLGTQVGSPAQLLVSHDGVIQKPVTDYTIATGGTQITFTTAPASGASIFITEISGAVGAPMNRDINGDELILDADADTSITADTDDQIDIRIAGADDFQFTANTFTAQSGSTIAGQAITATSLDLGDGNIANVGTVAADRVLGDADADTYIDFPGSDIVTLNTGDNIRFRIDDSGKLSSGGETAPDVSKGGLCLNQAQFDTQIFSLKSSDVAHGVTTVAETDTYYQIDKGSSNSGSPEVYHLTEGGELAMYYHAVCCSALNTGKGSGDGGAISLRAHLKGSGTDTDGTVTSNGNLLTIHSHNTVRFIFDAEGDFHADSSSTTFDTYDDAQLARAFDLSHGRGVVDSKFDKFVAYNHEKLAELQLVGRERDGKPNHMVNVCGMQRLHNGAIWQQYEKHNQLLEAVYDLAKEAVGEEKANAILDKHEVKRLQ